MIALTRKASEQLVALSAHFDALERPEALRNLIRAIEMASDAIERDPAAGFQAPRPYPWLARPGRAWVKSHRYWVAYRLRRPLMIVGIFYDSADIPGRF